jgi:hypothetical protein
VIIGETMTENPKVLNGSLLQICTFGIILLLVGILFLLLSGTLFALLFDRTDLLFGIRLDGSAAGVSLFAKLVVEFVLLILITRYPASFGWFVKISLVFSVFLLVDSIVTAKMTLQSYQYFSPVLGLFFLSSIGLFVLQIIKSAEGKQTRI